MLKRRRRTHMCLDLKSDLKFEHLNVVNLMAYECVGLSELSNLTPVGAALFDAYQHTEDGEGVTLQAAINEIGTIMGGEYGPFLSEASFVIQDDHEVVTVILITLFEDQPFVTYLFTKKSYQSQGLATYLLVKSATSLKQMGYSE
ncbi:MAG: GNAT family N-acetyltransferase, partial [Turicibacter sp.]